MAQLSTSDPQPTDVFSPKEQLSVDAPVGIKAHADSDLHLIGETLPAPRSVASFSSVAAVGVSPSVARSDHAHGLADGTAAAPSLGWGGLGFWKGGASLLNLSVAGVTRHQWDYDRFYSVGGISIGGWSSDVGYGSVVGQYGYMLLGKVGGGDTSSYLRASGNVYIGATGYVDRITVNGTTVTIVPTIACNAIGCGVITGSTSTLGGTTIGSVAGGYQGISAPYGDVLLGKNGVDGSVYLRCLNAGYDVNLSAVSGYIDLRANWTKMNVPDWGGSGYDMYVDVGTNIVECVTSKRSIKEEIKELDPEFVSGIIDRLKPSSFIFKRRSEEIIPELDEWRKRDIQYGFIADEVADADPRLAVWDVVKDEDGNETEEMEPASWGSHKMIAIAIAEIKSLRKRVAELESK